MEKATSLTCVFIGAFLIYIGLFGTYGIGIYGWAGNVYTDPFNSLDTSFWQFYLIKGTYGQVEVAGTLKFYWTTPLSTQERACIQTVNAYEINEISIDIVGPREDDKIHAILLQVGDFKTNTYYQIYKDQYSHWEGVKWFQNGQMERLKDITGIPADLSGSLKIVFASGTAKFYIDGAEVYSETNRLTFPAYVRIVAMASPDHDEYAEFDNFYMSVGGQSPPPPPPGTGTLDIQCLVDGVPTPPDNKLVTINGEYQYTDDNGHLSLSVPPGTYIVSASYQGETKSQTVTVYEGKTTTVQLMWTTTGAPPPPSFPQIPDLINLINSPEVRSLMLVSGVILAGIGLINLIAGGKKHTVVPVATG